MPPPTKTSVRLTDDQRKPDPYARTGTPSPRSVVRARSFSSPMPMAPMPGPTRTSPTTSIHPG